MPVISLDAEEAIKELARSVRSNLYEGKDHHGSLAGSQKNPCCPWCVRMYDALMSVEQIDYHHDGEVDG